MIAIHLLAVGPENSYIVYIGQADFENDCRVRGRRRLSPPRGAGWEPANALPDGISRAEKSHTSQHCPLARATAGARAQGSGPP